jgi:tetratricopeptide (TPR) repeat protein
VARKGHLLYISLMVVVFPLLALLLAASPAASARSPKSLAQIARQADAARAGDRLNEAIELYREGIRLRASWGEGWWELGSLLYDQDRFPEAQAAFRRFVAITPKPGPAYAFLGLCEYETKEYDRALQHFRAWARSGWAGTPELIDVAVFHFALLLTREGRFVEPLYLLSIEARKNSSPALVEAMGLASLRMANLPEEYPPERREMVWLAGKSAFYASLDPDDFERVDEYARNLLVHYDQEPNVHYFRGTIFNFEHQRADAAAQFRRELQISPQHIPAMLELAKIDLAAAQISEASLLAKRAVELEPKNAEGRHVLGQALFASDQFQSSARELEAAKRLAPDGALIRFHLARAYTALGREKEAQQELAAVKLLEKKEQVLAPPAERLRQSPEVPK